MYKNLDDVNIKKLNVTTPNGNKLEEEIQSVCNGVDYDLGVVEEVSATARKTSILLSKLVVLLLDKKVLTEEELKKITKYIF